jgi:BASS family bile acid:Na+ symporter
MSLEQYMVLALQASILLTVFGLGLTATWQEATYLLRQPGLLLRTLLSMSLIMPAIAAVVAALLPFPLEAKVGLIAVALSPVPPLVWKRQLSAGGRREYAIGLLVAMALLAIVIVPVSVSILARIFGGTAFVTPAAIAKVMAMTILAPLGIGLVIRQVLPVAEKASTHILALAGLLLVVGAVMLLIGMWPLMRGFLGNGLALALAGVSALGLLVGHLLGGPLPGDRTSLAIATACRHPAAALVIATSGTAVSDKKSELAVILLYLVVATIVSTVYQKWRTRGAKG